MVMIDEVVEWGATRIVARRTVRMGDAFVIARGLDDAALLECIAQTIAAGDACYAAEHAGKVKRGYLTGLTGVTIHSRAAVGDTIEVSADCLKRMDGMGLFEVRAQVGQRLLAQGRYKLFVEIEYPRSGA